MAPCLTLQLMWGPHFFRIRVSWWSPVLLGRSALQTVSSLSADANKDRPFQLRVMFRASLTQTLDLLFGDLTILSSFSTSCHASVPDMWRLLRRHWAQGQSPAFSQWLHIPSGVTQKLGIMLQTQLYCCSRSHIW